MSKKSWTLFILAALLCCAAPQAQAQTSSRPGTGTYIKDTARTGYGQLLIHNNWTMDSVAVLTDMNVKPLDAVYIRSKESFTIENITDGSYGLYFTVGDQWNPKEKKFSSVLGYYRFGSPLKFETTGTGDDTEISIFEMTLYEVPLGDSNFVPQQFEFPKL